MWAKVRNVARALSQFKQAVHRMPSMEGPTVITTGEVSEHRDGAWERVNHLGWNAITTVVAPNAYNFLHLLYILAM